MARAATRIIFVIGVVGLFVVGWTVSAAAADRARMDDPFEITADRIDYDGARDLYVATGHVRIVQTGRSLAARWVAFSTVTRVGVAEGDVELLDGSDELQAEFMVFDVESLQGMLFQGRVDAGSQGFRIRAAELIRTGKNTFTAKDGVFTTCRCEPGERLPWQITSKRADIELGDYGTVWNSTFDVLGVPVLWIPWAFFPVKSERETGFLLPQLQFGGRSGIGGGLPFFWAAHPQLNVTLTPQYYNRRGYKQDLEFEYVFGKESEGELFLAGSRDKLEEPSLATPSRDNRWAILWHHDQFLPAKLRWHTDLKLSSDNLYADDFSELRDEQSFRFIESTTNIARGFGRSDQFGLMVGARFADDQQGSKISAVAGDDEFQDSDDFVLQRWFEGRADVQPGAAVGPLGIEMRVDTEVIQFGALRRNEEIFDDQQFLDFQPGVGFRARSLEVVKTDGAFWDVGFDGFNGFRESGERDGRFQPGEPIADRGTRAVIHPRLARVFRLGNLAEFVPEVGWSQTLYSTSRQSFAERGLVTGRADLRGRLQKDFQIAPDETFRHVVEPKIGWAFVSSLRQAKNPLFVPQPTVQQARIRTLTLENVTRNPSDRIQHVNQVVLGVGQRFYTRSLSDGTRLRGDLSTAIDWDFADDDGFGRVVADGHLFNFGPFEGGARAAFDPEELAFDEGEVGANATWRFTNPFVKELSLSTRYRYLRRIPRFLETNRGFASAAPADDAVNQVNFSGRLELTSRIRLSYSMVYSLLGGGEGGNVTNATGIEYVSKCRCWGVGVEVSNQRREGIGAGVTIRFLGLGDEKSGLFDNGFGTGLSLF